MSEDKLNIHQWLEYQRLANEEIQKLKSKGVNYKHGSVVDANKCGTFITKETQEKINKIKESIKKLRPF